MDTKQNKGELERVLHLIEQKFDLVGISEQKLNYC